MRIHIATDHAGMDFSTQLQHHLAAQGHDVIDHGPLEYDALDDYPAFCIRAAQAVVRDQEDGIEALGVVFGGSGNGEQIAANKVRGVRAALVWSIATAELAREHNDANVIAIGARQHTFDEASAFIDRFVATPFSGDERHSRRIAQIAAFELDGALQPDPRAAVTQPDVLADGDGFDPEAG
ncbi:ribose-5-phosphate isomerase [Microbacterium sp. dk485]|uniref:ribose-5-phosphate isomerase n=1 Tax=Microbacterium sp. dk485 TaxID=2560021 RepID=UPI00107360A7|nr:ribose-5-phosphate isomerase [Microbacterium sp. dk485]TFV81944.1 ribose-5-phosphate isomerase [Microbacterium sp. dk485]